MKRFLPLLLLLALALTGCQSTPEAPIVAGKSSDDLIEKAAAETSGALAQRVEAPARYEDAFASTGGELQVTVDAAVTVPDADKVPIIRVRPANITQEQVDVLMDQVVQGELYDFGVPKTKAEIADEIVAAKQQLAEGPPADQAGARYSTEEGSITWEEYMEEYYLPILQEQYDAAPETAERTPATGQLTGDGSGLKQAGGVNTTAELGWETLSVTDSDNMDIPPSAQYIRAETETGFIFSYNTAEQFRQTVDYAGVDIGDLTPVTCTAEEAQAMCDAVVKALGIPDMTLYAAEKKYGGGKEAPRCCWELQYTRNIGGVPVAYTSYMVGLPDMLPSDAGEAVYIAPWDYERLNFYVNDDGIVGLNWQSPCQLTDTVTEDAALMDFSDIADIFQKMFVVKYDDQDMDVAISSIRLSYMRVSEQDKSYTGLLVPVWDFYGSKTWTLGTGEDYTFYDPDQSLLTINAVDGTVIDRTLGY